jgi:DNA-directed RNA polymerase subunit RPC12/RpoP
MSKVPIMGYRCQRCGHEWLPRKNSKGEPKVCPKCKSPYWNTPKTMQKKKRTKKNKKSESPVISLERES